MWVLGFGIVIVVLGSSRRGVARIPSWHPKVLPCEHLPRKMPHTQVIKRIVVAARCVLHVFACALWLCAVVVCLLLCVVVVAVAVVVVVVVVCLFLCLCLWLFG